ncbi:aminotransferase class V-fold PLP-dependent enzyme [Mycoplasma sp. NEAQ87857]|uniref:aminotransferase class V-fold PLP-dependent enzyme n=1 Tax=Mycoplasma sp. NEAQ87857 TaxID=2683967 RepID=UPI001316284D|nr:aminotransferase class V-fold PLP-dependent enzyme [Mycoplasma sp. NEAQ87857]QGZ97881.1 aminotransferase class V-fold PLP-dependent enzyme [Mycoplasma sp. NEAQ87857]
MNQKIRDQFPILQDITYFDSAALVLKPKIAIDAMNDFYLNKSISSRTADTPLGNIVNQVILETRQKVAHLLDAKDNEVIFTSGTTESINYFANMVSSLIQANDVILLSAYNHSSNLIPWFELAKRTNAIIKISQNIIDDIDDKVKIVAISQETNNFNQNFDINLIANYAHKHNAIVFSDAAQAISHQKVSLNTVDVVAFSTNKFYGPTGMGVLAIKESILKQLRPTKFGGGSVDEILKDANWTMKKTISAFEPGTPDLAGFFMFDKALDFFNSIGYEKSQAILLELSNYLHAELNKLDNVQVYTKAGDNIALINLYLKVNDQKVMINPQDVATYLGDRNIYTIAGIFCAPYLRNIKQQYSYLRISLGIYNTKDDIDKLIKALANGGDFYAF